MGDFFQSQAFYVILYIVLFGGATYGMIRGCMRL